MVMLALAVSDGGRPVRAALPLEPPGGGKPDDKVSQAAVSVGEVAVSPGSVGKEFPEGPKVSPAGGRWSVVRVSV